MLLHNICNVCMYVVPIQTAMTSGPDMSGEFAEASMLLVVVGRLCYRTHYLPQHNFRIDLFAACARLFFPHASYPYHPHGIYPSVYIACDLSDFSVSVLRALTGGSTNVLVSPGIPPPPRVCTPLFVEGLILMMIADVFLLAVLLHAASECGVDFPGVISSGGKGNICCVEECGVCGGVGCADFAKELGYSKEHCCTSAIKESDVMCSDSMAAPCVIKSSGKLFACACCAVAVGRLWVA